MIKSLRLQKPTTAFFALRIYWSVSERVEGGVGWGEKEKSRLVAGLEPVRLRLSLGEIRDWCKS